MSDAPLPAPATLLRHREPALLLAATERFADGRLACRSIDRPRWEWPEMLEAAAQTAGLLAGLQGDGFDATAVIAEYRDVHIHAAHARGRLRLAAELGRRVLQFRMCRVDVRSDDGRLLLDGTVAIAPGTRADA